MRRKNAKNAVAGDEYYYLKAWWATLLPACARVPVAWIDRAELYCEGGLGVSCATELARKDFWCARSRDAVFPTAYILNRSTIESLVSFSFMGDRSVESA